MVFILDRNEYFVIADTAKEQFVQELISEDKVENLKTLL